MSFIPLSFPTPWPPPPCERHFLRRIPILGWLIGGLWEGLTGYRDPCHRAIELHITEQLEARPEQNVNWPTDSNQRRVVEILANIVCIEKCLSANCVALHPDDPVVLLMWGPFDDLTPIEFRFRLGDAFGRKFADDVFAFLFPETADRSRLLDNGRTVGQLVEYCAIRTSNAGSRSVAAP
jgi:hypothetical protein